MVMVSLSCLCVCRHSSLSYCSLLFSGFLRCLESLQILNHGYYVHRLRARGELDSALLSVSRVQMDGIRLCQSNFAQQYASKVYYTMCNIQHTCFYQVYISLILFSTFLVFYEKMYFRLFDWFLCHPCFAACF